LTLFLTENLQKAEKQVEDQALNINPEFMSQLSGLVFVPNN
jgi:hypothetical protein